MENKTTLEFILNSLYQSKAFNYVEDMTMVTIMDSQTGEVYINDISLKNVMFLLPLLRDVYVEQFEIETCLKIRIDVNNYGF